MLKDFFVSNVATVKIFQVSIDFTDTITGDNYINNKILIILLPFISFILSGSNTGRILPLILTGPHELASSKSLKIFPS